MSINPEPLAPRRKALVTGCSSGIGLAVTVRLLDQGWAVTGQRTQGLSCWRTASGQTRDNDLHPKETKYDEHQR